MRLWLDDIREMPPKYTHHAHSVDEAKDMIRKAEKSHERIEFIDCDHDLGIYASQGGDGIKLLDWLAERGTFYPIKLHTMNPVGRANMQRTLDRYWEEQSCLENSFKCRWESCLNSCEYHHLEHKCNGWENCEKASEYGAPCPFCTGMTSKENEQCDYCIHKEWRTRHYGKDNMRNNFRCRPFTFFYCSDRTKCSTCPLQNDLDNPCRECQSEEPVKNEKCDGCIWYEHKLRYYED